jgi:hypothetical protein
LGPEIDYLLLLLHFYERSRPTQNAKKKKLNVGEVQTLPPLHFVISQRETKDTKRQSKDGKERKHYHMGGRKL